eukprot:TRINITY_DN13359_c0_g1_i1.p1 TRINITY_DN13359_c0_g1~~TRINITY_DN13359_c0_g1_i1.p1  ORF type:complete len:329 (-),score=71.95 TRINITY_DN13359_c0_g1_i1:78-1064(-)
MDVLQLFLSQQGFMILDGGLASELERQGEDIIHKLWSFKVVIEKPFLIRKVHLDYLNSGADIITTATYQASIEGLQNYAIEGKKLDYEQSCDMMRKCVQLALQTRDEFWVEYSKHNKDSEITRLKPLVAISFGPYGAFLADGSEYRGDYNVTKRELVEWHRKRYVVLRSLGADLFLFETIPCLLEAEAIVELLAEFPNDRALLSFTCKDKQHTSNGEDFSQCVQLANASDQIIGVGVNCSDPANILDLIQCANSTKDNIKPLLVYPNSGEKWEVGVGWVHDEKRIPIKNYVQSWYTEGCKIIGGCCRVTPEEIHSIRAELINVCQKKK